MGLHAWAEEFQFATQTARLTIRSDGAVSGFVAVSSGRALLRTANTPFAAVKKDGRLFPVTSIERRSPDLLQFTFGASGVVANYRVTAQPAYLAIESADLRGDGIEEVRFVQTRSRAAEFILFDLSFPGQQAAVRTPAQFSK